VELKTLVGQPQNVHNAAIEAVDLTTIAKITAQPLLASSIVDQSVALAVSVISAATKVHSTSTLQGQKYSECNIQSSST